MALANKPNMSVLWAETGSVEQPETIKIQQGWVNEIPPFEYQNWWQLRVDQVIRHIFEAGIPAWDATTSYTAGRSLVQASNGIIFRATADNVGQNPLTTTVWAPLIDTTRYVPPGALLMVAGPTAPAGYLKANGAAISRTAYPELFSYLGTSWGAGNGTTTFNLPDLRGHFPRFWDDGRGVDLNRTLFSVQASQNLAHTHNGVVDSDGYHNHLASSAASGDHVHALNTSGVRYNASFVVDPAEGTTHTGTGSIRSSTTVSGNHTHSIFVDANGLHTHTFNTNSSGANESRPINTALLVCIKY